MGSDPDAHDALDALAFGIERRGVDCRCGHPVVLTESTETGWSVSGAPYPTVIRLIVEAMEGGEWRDDLGALRRVQIVSRRFWRNGAVRPSICTRTWTSSETRSISTYSAIRAVCAKEPPGTKKVRSRVEQPAAVAELARRRDLHQGPRQVGVSVPGGGQARKHDRFLPLGDPQHQGSEAISRKALRGLKEWEQPAQHRQGAGLCRCHRGAEGRGQVPEGHEAQAGEIPQQRHRGRPRQAQAADPARARVQDAEDIPGLLSVVGEAIGAGRHHCSALDAERTIINRLHDRQALLVVDEAHHLRDKLLDELRIIRDRSGCGLALLADKSIGMALARCQQVDGRIGLKIDLATQPVADVEDTPPGAARAGTRAA